MANEIIMPKFGQTVESAEIVCWRKKEGDSVEKGDVLLEIQTDKATLEVECFHAGVILKLFAAVGDSVPVMSVIGYIGKPGEDVPDAPSVVEAAKPGRAAPPAPGKPAAGKLEAGKPGEAQVKPVQQLGPHVEAAATPRRFSITPRAKRLALESLIDPAGIPGTGPEGRVIERDVRKYLENTGAARIKTTPVAKALIMEHGLDILNMRRMGHGGRVCKEDVMRAVRERPKAMSPIRRIIARRMWESVTTMAHYYVTVKVDMTDLLEFRKMARRERGLKASVGDFITKAAALCLREMPVVNSVCLGDTIRTHQDINIGVAVALDDGLIVPVIRNADTLTLNEMGVSSRDLAKRAKENKLTPEEFEGGTFTISNMGMLGVDEFTAIINPGEGAILAVGAAVETPVVRRGEIVVRTLMKMTLSSDHRVIDGAVAARFLKAVKTKLENMESWHGL